ncbi:hypothetical protein BDV97DRAFT_309611, partial [Delphinella strobiligena]
MTVDIAIPPLRVAIIGGGPGGLATAIALQEIPNVKVKIYEQASLLREVGAGISVGQNSWNVLELLGVADSLTSGYSMSTVEDIVDADSSNGRTGEELHRREYVEGDGRPSIRTQRTMLQSALLGRVEPDTIQLSKKLTRIEKKDEGGVELRFKDDSVVVADLVVGADGIRSVVRDAAWPDYEIKFTGTTIWRALLPWGGVKDLDPRFETTAWWHGPTSHVYLSRVGENLGEIAARSWQDPVVHSADKVSWGVSVSNAYLLTKSQEYLPQIKEVLTRVADGDWREFAAFAGPELSQLTAWDNQIVLVGDASHALSGAFGSGAGFAMEDGWILARALQYFQNDLSRALPLFDAIRLPYYSRMYAHLASEGLKRADTLKNLIDPTCDDKVKIKIIKDGGAEMGWIYQHNIADTW